MLDLLIKNGQDIKGNPIEIGIKDGLIECIDKTIDEEAIQIIELSSGQYISPGWIDSHVHCYEKMTLYYDFPDEIGYKKGVTTVIDAGSTGENNIKEFYELSKKSKTNIYALMNISKDGIVTQDELADLSKIDESVNLERIKELPDFIIGIKARMSKTVVGSNDIIPLKMAKSLQKAANDITLMVHIGSAPPELEDILNLLEKGDIVTHCYNGKLNGILNASNEIKPYVWEAYNRGVLFDIGHGTDSFNFNVGKQAIENGLICKTISTDIYHRNRENGPVYDLATTLEKALSIGIPFEEVIKMVTSHPAEIFNLSNKGRLEKGMDADLTVFDMIEEEKIIVDSNGNEAIVRHQIIPNKTVVAGELFDL
ncbi:amidohydrolase/deacetylase family metallohydrolase [Vagococcus xieshaowenii]|uniref:Amidohydrolase/deacetylase family metallohydrolase n=1 Tax=Vagococcus xieshaowenii TaxID=2562451 RepID=A0AAJ5JLB2_9ENTE|nr:amidohydrolase/deacetylase family metallohydrolase [Vagococcus xieshaowenii]QCA29394.1 amidohydrolase/deacetylase family metallohydrolase [Vagococcus xieshaowenii]TFZ39313.1 amidohydrolase/deacetylase family metallohydrolase [Vagococcus xieshaowenii]